jgi:hypothetical protein
MVRLARVLAIDAPHHMTRHGHARQLVFEGDASRLVYFDLLLEHCRLDRLKLPGYCRSSAARLFSCVVLFLGSA